MKTITKVARSGGNGVCSSTKKQRGAAATGVKAVRKPKSTSAKSAKATAREDHLKASRAPTVLHAPMGALSFDPDEFMHHVESLDLSDDEKLELLNCVWQIMTSFVAWNFSGAAAPMMLEAESPGMIPFEDTGNEQKEQHANGVEERIRDEAD